MNNGKSPKKNMLNTKYRRRQGILFSFSYKKLIEDGHIKLKNEENPKYMSKKEDSPKKPEKSISKKLLRTNLFFESEKNDLNKLYGDDEKTKYQIVPIINFLKIKDCSMMKYGARKSSIEIDYSYCKTCDNNSLKPICLPCINKCHYGHVIKFILKKGHIKCSCGEKNHMIMKINYSKISNMNCLCNEWNSIANLKYYYINKNKEPICILCNYCCQGDNHKNNIIKVKKNKSIPCCSCKNKDIHNDKRIICEKLLNLISGSSDFDNFLHPIQFVNMLFKSKNNFKFIFEYFDFFISDLNGSKDNSHIINFLSKLRRIDVEYTNIYKTLLILEKIIEKTEKNNIYFFHKEVIKYFSFDIIKKILEVLISSSIEEKLFWQLTNKFLYLFHKIYINEKTKSLNKFKLTDLKHLNFFKRITVIKENTKKFSESKDIISFLFNLINHININHSSNIEAVHCIKEIMSIFRKFSCYNLIKSYDMLKICSNIIESFNWIRDIKIYNLKNVQNDIKSKIDYYYFNNISIKLFYIIMKSLQNFIYNYNDSIINSIISNKRKYPDIDNIKPHKICFIFKKNELGELIYKISIYILSTLERDYKKSKNKRIILTQRLCEQIIHYALIEDDYYLLNIIDSIFKFKINFSIEKNKYYSDYLKQTNLVSNIFNQYFNFEKSIEETLEMINDSLNFFLKDKKIKNISSFKKEKFFQEFNSEQQLAIFYTNFYCLISKTIEIMQNHQKRVKESEKIEYNDMFNDLIKYIPSNLEDDIIKKILLFYFSFTKNSSDCSFLILSHYIIKELLKLPKKYCHILFILFHRCMKNIFESEYNTIKIDSSFLLKRLYNYLNELMSFQDDEDNIVLSCVDEFLQILELATLNYEYSLFSGFIYKIQYLIIMIDKNFKLVKKFFEIENKEAILHKNNGTNILSKIFATYMKLINLCFDFSIEEDRKRIKELIDISEIIYALENYKLTFELKTEFIRYIRKYMIDLKYSYREKDLYITAFRNNKDNLEEIKNNSLLNYYNYPTKLLSFLKDLYNITSITYFKEKIEEKNNENKDTKVKRNSNIRNWVIENKGNKDINLSNEISDLGESKLDHSGFFEEYKNNNLILNNYYKSIHNLESSYNRTPNRGSNLSTIIPQTSNFKQSKIGNRLSMIIPHEKKRIMNIYISNINEDDIEEKELDKKDLKILKDILKENNNELLYNKIKEMNLFEDAFNNKFYNIINKELEEALNKDWKLTDDTKIIIFKNYIENGILIPIIFYFKKVMIMIDSFSGNEMIKLFSLLSKCLKLKLFLYKNNNIWKKSINKKENSTLLEQFNIFKYNNINISIIDHTKFLSKENIDITKESLEIINSKRISIYDYSIFYEIIEKELFSLIKEKKAIIFNYKFYKTKYKNDSSINIIMDDFENAIKKDDKDFIKSEEHRRLIKLLIIYKYNKSICDNENNSSILSILSELNLEYEINFRNIFLSIVIKRVKEINLKSEFVIIHYYLLLILLDLQTEETQNEIMNIIGLNDNKNFLKDCSKILHTKIILSIIDYLNPTDGLMNYNYFISYNILCVFKSLCLNNNKFFKMNFVRSISYNYISNIFNFFKINPIIQNHTVLETTIFCSGNFADGNAIDEKDKPMIYQNSEDNIIEHPKINKIKFYDFFLILIPKICLISNWNKYLKLEQNNYLYELFSSIIDLLTEIINENESEMLSIIFDEIVLIKEGAHLEKIKNIESFDEFMTNISKIILDKKNNNEINNKVKKKLLDYINSIIEEKESDEIIEKCIEKHLNINKIYKNISNLMKSYFIKNIQLHKLEKDKEKALKTKEKEDSKIQRKLKKKEKKNDKDNKDKKINDLYIKKTLTYNIKETHLNDKTTKKEIEESSVSKIKMLSSILDPNQDIKKNLFALNTIDSNKNEKNENKIIIEENKNIIEKKNNEIKLSRLTFGKYLYKYFKMEFRDNSKFIESLDFKLCSSYYKYIKFTKIKKEELEKNEIENIIETYYKEKDKKHKNILEDIYYFNNSSNSNENITQIEKDYIEKYFIEKFFEKILSTIEVLKPNKENKLILFTRLPLIKFLSKETKLEFWENVNRDSEVSKKYDLIKYIDYFLEEIYYNKNNQTKFVFLTKINFHYLLIISYSLSAFLNLFFLFTMKGDNQISNEETLMQRIKKKKDINILINKSSKEWDNIYQLLCLSYLILNAIFIIIWIVQQLPLYYTINKIDYIKKENEKKKLKFIQKVIIISQILINKGDNILPLIYEFIVCLLCILLKQGKMIYPFLLIPILYINKTLRNIILSIKMNIYSFTLTFCFASIIMYLFSNLYFFFYNFDFEKEINYYEDNYCKTLVFAFLNALDSGLRARGGLGDSAKRISFNKNKYHYIYRLIMDDIFFFLIVIIMIDLVFGIVLRSFDKLQHINYKYQIDKTHHCFICNSKKENLEKIRINFDEHINMTHNVWNYIEYLIKIKIKDETDVNPMNNYIFNKINKKDISFFPTYKYYENEIFQENNFSEDKNNSILAENFPNYKIK